MKKILKFLSYFLLVIAIIFVFPFSESLKIKESFSRKKILEKIRSSDELQKIVTEDTREFQEEYQESEEIKEFDSFLVRTVIDGDTIVLEDGKIVRLIGINAPEKYQNFGKEAFSKLKDLVTGKEIFLEFDKEIKDKYGRLLAYVFTEDYFINYELLKSGLAYLMTIRPNTKYLNLFKNAQNEAKKNKLGIWGGEK